MGALLRRFGGIAFVVSVAGPAADPWYTLEGRDPPFAEVLKASGGQPGERFNRGGALGSRVRVHRQRLEQQVGPLTPIPKEIRLHTQFCSAIPRSEFDRWSRWYQEDGDVQIFRLFKGEQNIRNGAGDEGTPGRVETYCTLTVRPGTWREWEGTYTIIQPVRACIFQLMHEGSLWPFHLDMSEQGDIVFLRRRPVPGEAKELLVARNMVGTSLRIKVRANGTDYEVYQKAPLGPGDWKLVARGSFTAAKDNKISFRWGMYCGSRKGQSVPNDALLFVTGVQIR